MWWDNTRHTIHKKLQTRFYYDISDTYHFVVLHETKGVLRAVDKKRGYVERSWFLDKYKNAVQGIRLTKRSCLVECVIEKDDPKELFRVYVR